ncbi:Acyltransferase 3 [Tenacibaculum litopenaei]|uniref:acyltransferase family protein n=1 Tax=Tenacibaculum litopenaei TaxID=396016 RepID=UPI003892E0A7
MNTPDTNRVYQIDLFRFIAALSVVLYHYLFRSWAGNIDSNLDFYILGSFFKYGYLGVDLFFIISGFVIALSIQHRSITRFAISRISRLYPVYWVCVTLSFLVITFFGGENYNVSIREFIVNLSMFQNYLGTKNVDGVYWTLFVEMKFYLFTIGMYLLVNKLHKVNFDYLLIFWSVITILNIPFGHLYLMKKINYYFIVEWMPYFIAGMTFYQIYSQRNLSIKYVLILLISLGTSIHYAILRLPSLESSYKISFSPLIVVAIICVFYIIMLMVSTHKMQKINSSIFIKLGVLTYPLYLIHQNIGFIIFSKFQGVSKFLLVSIVILVMLSISFVLSNYYEPWLSKRIRKLLNKFTAHILINKKME